MWPINIHFKTNDVPSVTDGSSIESIPTVNVANGVVTFQKANAAATAQFLSPAFANVALTGDYNDLINAPAGGSANVAWADVTDKPSFANVALSGDYSDLTNKPALANVALSGSYADLSGSPSFAYSTNAVAVGTWINGQTVYRYVATGTINYGSSSVSGLPSAGTVISINGIMSTTDGAMNIAVPGRSVDVTVSGSSIIINNTDMMFTGGTATLIVDYVETV